MKRPVGVILSTVVLGLSSTGTLLLAAVMTMAGFAMGHTTPMSGVPGPGGAAPHLTPAILQGFVIGMALCLAIVAAWKILTIVGLLRLRNWARYSVLVIGGFLTFIGVTALLGTLAFLQMMPAIRGGEKIPASTMQMVMVVEGLFYLVLATVVIWWLVYFNLKPIKNCFLPDYATDAGYDLPTGGHRSGRFAHTPTSIIVLGCLFLLSAVFCAGFSFVHVPAFFCGAILTGAGVHLLYLGFAIAAGLIGWGLLRMDNWARLGTYALAGFGTVNMLLLLTPWGRSRYDTYNAEMLRNMNLPATPAVSPMRSGSVGFMITMAVFCLVFYGIQVWILERHRRAFTVKPPPLPVL
jgi:hypothetical protein